jgi:hypothetical protein
METALFVLLKKHTCDSQSVVLWHGRRPGQEMLVSKMNFKIKNPEFKELLVLDNTPTASKHP